MKNPKYVLKAIMLLCVLLVSMSCAKDDTTQESETLSTTFYKPSGVITQEKAEVMKNAWSYKNAGLTSKSGSVNFEDDNRSLWWSVDDLRNYLDYAENEAKEQGYNMTGVRVYFAAYPEENYKSTMFFAPTGYALTAKQQGNNEEDLPVPPLNEGEAGGCADCP